MRHLNQPWNSLDRVMSRSVCYFMGIAEMSAGALLATAVAGSAVVGAGAAIASSEISSSGQQSAAAQQAAAAGNATQVQYNEWLTTQQNQLPWVTQGTSAVNQLGALMAPGGALSTAPASFQFDPSKITQDPGYAFRTQQGNDQITAAGAAAGNLGSGNLGTALVNYGQQAGSQEYANAYARTYQQQLDQYNSQLNSQNTLYNRLGALAGTGQTAVNNLATAGSNMATNVGNIAIGQGNNQAAATVASTNAWANGLNNVGNNVGNQVMGGVGAYNQNQLYQQYLNSNSMNTGGGTTNLDQYTSLNF